MARKGSDRCQAGGNGKSSRGRTIVVHTRLYTDPPSRRSGNIREAVYSARPIGPKRTTDTGNVEIVRDSRRRYDLLGRDISRYFR